jgi:hypothetical protein
MNQVGSGSNVSNLHFGGAYFKSWTGQWLAWLRVFVWFSSVLPGEYCDSALN